MQKGFVEQLQKQLSRQWEEEGIYKVKKIPDREDKVYVLGMFPYPSGSGLHMGHTRIYTGLDVLARYFRLKGKTVLNPMGWDAFGLPAENYAIKNKTTPQKVVPENIKSFKQQMLRLGFSFDWDREFSTTDPEYYQFTQFLFIHFFKMGLLYKKNTPVYFCPYCKTGLAEEEVLNDGTHERCGNKITRKFLPQWMFKITDYADSLLEELNNLDWPEGILEMQRNWIGRSEGAEIKFKIQDEKLKIKEIKVFTTRVDTVFGVTALVLAPEHPLVQELLDKQLLSKEKLKEIKDYVEEAKSKLDLTRTELAREKTGVNTGLFALHPLTGERIPIWIADYVLGWYGEGAIMLVPAHDERDYEFAKKFNIPIKVVVIPEEGTEFKVEDNKLFLKQGKEWIEGPYTDKGILVNSGEFTGLNSLEAQKEIIKKIKSLGLGKPQKQYKLRDWIFSRQRYWGEPIPMVYCSSCAAKGLGWIDLEGSLEELKKIAGNGENYKRIVSRWKEVKDNIKGWFPLKEEELPLTLPEVEYYEPTGTGESPLARIKDWVKTSCPVCGSEAVRETDTMPNWAGSSWYFLAFPFWNKNKDFLSIKALRDFWKKEVYKALNVWMPVDWYIGGAEHAVLHLLYSRFWMHALYDSGMVPVKEPFYRLRNVGMLLAEDHRKMSKSLGNVVNPDDLVNRFGSDVVRTGIMFIAPFSQEVAWSEKVLRGVSRFLNRVYQIYRLVANDTELKKDEDKELESKLQRIFVFLDKEIPDVKFNTAIAKLMEFLNLWEKVLNEKKIVGLSQNLLEGFLIILSPFAPFLTEHIWREILGKKDSIHLQKWPIVDEKSLEEESINIPVQINGKVKAIITVKKNATKDQVVDQALQNDRVRKALESKEYKVIYVPNKIINFVI